MSHYIATTDITDSVIIAFVNASDTRLEAWLDLVDSEIEAIAESRDVDVDDITTPVHAKVKEFGIAYFGLCVCSDNIGVNNVDTAQDEKYRVKYDIYLEKTNRLRTQITKEMLYDEDGDGELTAQERSNGGVIWFG